VETGKYGWLLEDPRRSSRSRAPQERLIETAGNGAAGGLIGKHRDQIPGQA
jgi:hypothetical protein